MEGTYGNRLHEAQPDPDYKDRELARVIHESHLRGGNLIIPSFAVGRTQELLFSINKLIRGGVFKGIGAPRVFIDSPLGIEATQIFERNARDYYDEEALAHMEKHGSLFLFDSLTVARTVEESMRINSDKGSKVIISSSGMCEAGRIRHHLKHNLWRKDSTALFVGYQAVGTPGRAILDGAKKVKFFGEPVEVRARIERIEGFSGHADQAELMRWVRSFSPKPKKVFITHGEAGALEAFSRMAVQEGFKVLVPELYQSVDLEKVSNAPASPCVMNTFLGFGEKERTHRISSA
jgi:metallo-beta-lactamase family protein